MIAQHEALARYVHAVLIDGDYLNDWLTYIPTYLHTVIVLFGHLIAYVTGA